MKLYFSSKSLEKSLTQDQEMRKQFGDIYKKLRLRMNELDAVDSLADISPKPPQRRHMLRGDYRGCFAVDVSANWRIIFEPYPDGVPYLENGNIDYFAIKTIRVRDVRDYHE